MKKIFRIQRGDLLKSKNKTKLGLIIFKILLALFGVVLLAVLFFLMRNNFFVIKKVLVEKENVNCVTSNQIIDSSKLLRQNFFLINTKEIERGLIDRYLCIRSVAIHRIFPNKLNLIVFGRIPAAILIHLKLKEGTESSSLKQFQESISTESAKASEFSDLSFEEGREEFVVDSDGFIFSKNSESFSVPKIYIIGQDLDLQLGKKLHQDTITNALEILDKLADSVSDLKEAKIYSEKVFLINASAKLVFKLDGRVDSQLASLQLILSKAKIDEDKIEFIDLRFDKPVVRFAPKKK